MLSKPPSVLIIDTMDHSANADILHNPLASRAAGMALQNYVTPVWELHPTFEDTLSLVHCQLFLEVTVQTVF